MTLLTTEQVLDTYEFIVLRKILKKEFPWIKEVTIPSDNKLNEYRIIFLDIYLDPWELAKEEDLTVAWYMPASLERDGGFAFHFLNIMFAKEDHDACIGITHKIERVIQRITETPAIPAEFKLPKDRYFSPGAYILSPQSKVDPEITEKHY